MRWASVITAIVVLTAGVPLGAHDFWLAATWAPAQGEPLAITAGIGERFPVRTLFRPGGMWLAHWRLIGADGDVPGGIFRQNDLAMRADLTLPPGAYLGVAQVRPQLTEMDGPEFTEYLREERLHDVIAYRDESAESGLLAIERFYRFAKVAIRTGPGAAAHLTRPVGAPAEFVPETDPTTLRAGDPLVVQLLFNGHPVAEAPVNAVSDTTVVDTHTDADGRATVRLDRPGAWLIRTVQMQRLPPGDRAEWESYWVTLSFHTAAP